MLYNAKHDDKALLADFAATAKLKHFNNVIFFAGFLSTYAPTPYCALRSPTNYVQEVQASIYKYHVTH